MAFMAGKEEKRKANYGYFYSFENRYYLKNFEYRLAFCLTEKEWKRVDFDSVAPFDIKTTTYAEGWVCLDDDAAKEKLNDLLPEPDICEKTDLESRRQYLDRLVGLSMTTPRKVIGWISDYSLSTVNESEDEDLSHYAAMFAYLKENGYSFSGEQYQNFDAEPLFDDYTYLSFSRRGFGYLMALIHGNIGRYDYAGFTEFPWGDHSLTPSLGSLQGINVATDIELDKRQSEIFEKEIEQLIEAGKSPRFALSLEPRNDLYYWPDGIVFVRGESCQYEKIALVKDEEDKKKQIEEALEAGETIFLDDAPTREKYPFLLLVLSAA